MGQHDFRRDLGPRRQISSARGHAALLGTRHVVTMPRARFWVALVGPPGSEARFVGSLLSARLRVPLLSVHNAAAVERAHNTLLGQQLEQLVPQELQVWRLVQQLALRWPPLSLLEQVLHLLPYLLVSLLACTS